MRVLFVAAALLLLAPVAKNQTLTPVFTEAGHHKADISFDVANTTLQPVVLVIEPSLMTPGPKGPSYRALDPDTKVEVSEMSARVGVAQHHSFRAKISCPQDCVVAIWVTFLPPKKDNGVQLAIHFPATIYLCDKQKSCRANTLKAHGVS